MKVGGLFLVLIIKVKVDSTGVAPVAAHCVVRRGAAVKQLGCLESHLLHGRFHIRLFHSFILFFVNYYFGRSGALLYHHLLAVVDIQTLGRGLLVELHAADGVPALGSRRILGYRLDASSILVAGKCSN